ncbi:hypothetical protein KIMC2_14770 [Xylocopilactobacillus apis]|uniref:Uncharacterized protein n=1 Tax=Xylocopilactobacillus apis TaxID=2932183 RepID=A0AAU9D3M5_9LACO|nr:hypothetical protein KIMC2_14770 [Xylocopilactobacillus apis]
MDKFYLNWSLKSLFFGLFLLFVILAYSSFLLGDQFDFGQSIVSYFTNIPVLSNVIIVFLLVMSANFFKIYKAQK